MGWSTNQKALEKRKRQENKKQQKQKIKIEKIENHKWKDQITQKKIQEKKQRQEKKELELAKKRELKELTKKQQEQMEKLSKKKQKFQGKLTQVEIQKNLQEKQKRQQRKREYGDNEDDQNNNRKLAQYELARNLDQALQIFQNQGDKHPQKRYRAAFAQYVQKRQISLKFEYPKFKRSQRMQLMKKQFEKSVDNPYNKKVLAYNQQKRIKQDEEQVQQ